MQRRPAYSGKSCSSSGVCLLGVPTWGEGEGDTSGGEGGRGNNIEERRRGNALSLIPEVSSTLSPPRASSIFPLCSRSMEGATELT